MIGLTELIAMAEDDGRHKVMEAVLNPDFPKKSKVHDWRNYVPSGLVDLWGQLSIETRVVVFMMAEMQASREEWD